MKRHWRLWMMSTLLALLGGMNTLQHLTARSSPTNTPTDVAIVRAASWPVADAEVEALVRQAVALAGGLEDIVEPGDTVVVKPNLVWGADPDEGYTTDPRVTRTVVKLAREAGAGQVTIAEGAALYRDWHSDRGATVEAFHRCGYDADGDMIDDATGAPLVDLNNAGGLDQHDPTLVRQVQLQNGLIQSEYWLPNVILDADVLIGVPMLKNHSNAGVTLALKNQFGIAPSDVYHSPGSAMFKGALSHGSDDLGRHIVDLNLARPLDFVVVDGLRGMADGPIGNGLIDPPMRLIIAGRDAVAVDTIGALVMGYDPATVPYLGWAAGAGLGTDDVSLITVRGLRVSQVRRDFPAPYGDPPAQRADAVAPTVHITTPGEGHVVVENAMVKATASDNAPGGAISKVEFYAAGDLQVVATAPPYEVILDLNVYRGQMVPLRVVAYDLALNDAQDTATVSVVGGPAPGTTSFQTATIAIPTYPYTPCLTQTRSDGPYTFPWLDWSCYGNPTETTLENYELLVLENDTLRVTLIPELGGRIYQMIYKPTGHNELYQNPVIKPTDWGPPKQGWWLAVGGIEWCLPVDEHGYEWGTPWSAGAITSTAGVTVTIQDTQFIHRLVATIDIFLPADRAYLVITPHLQNPTGEPINYKYWTNAMIAPGEANTVGEDLRFIFSADQVEVHSSGDWSAHDLLDWPVHGGTDYSRLGNWNTWLGFFEHPAAQSGFIGVYDSAADEGVVRIFPPSVAQGTKGFGMGWTHPINPDIWTDDGSTYVELHGGVAPTFWDEATVEAGQTVEWTEYWYPASGIGTLSAATSEAALGVQESGGRFHVGAHATVPHAADTTTLYAWDRNTCVELARWNLPALGPGAPFTGTMVAAGRTMDDVAFVYLDEEGSLLAAVNPHDCLPPTASVHALPPWVATPAFAVTWSGQDTWSGIAAYDVQVRDGYEGLWTNWLTDTVVTSAVFSGTHGHTYAFRARARDLAGNQSTFGDETWGQTFTTVLTEPAPVLVTSHKFAAPRLFTAGQTIAYAIVISNTGSLTATVSVTDTPPMGMMVLTGTLDASTGPAPIQANGQIQWSSPVDAGTQVRLTYVLSPTAAIIYGVPLTNTAEIAGSVLGPFTRHETVMQVHLLWLPLVLRGHK